MNYFGEMAIYSSYGLMAQRIEYWCFLVYVWISVFFMRMALKEHSFGKKEGWEEYKQNTWMLIPKIGKSAIVSFFFYTSLIVLGALIYNNGGFEATVNLIKNM